MHTAIGSVHGEHRHIGGRRLETTREFRTVSILIIFALCCFAALPVADAQPPARVPRIGVLVSPSAQTTAPFLEAFRQGLRELGYMEGQHLTFERRYAEGRYERLPDLAAELVQLKVEVMVTSGTPATLAAQQATKTIPISFADLGDPVKTGLVASLARPGGNSTGLTILAEELSGKRLELLKEAVSGVTRVAVLVNPANPASATLWRETESAAHVLGMTLQIQEVREPNEFDTAFSAVPSKHAEALIVLPDGVFLLQRERRSDFAAKNRLPAM